MKNCILILILLTCGYAHADRNEQTRKDIAAFEKRWNGCSRLSGDPYFKCLKDAALAAASYYDTNVAYFHNATLGRPNPDAKVKRYVKIQDNYIKFRERQCEFEAAMKSGQENPAYVQKARCHFRTALDFVLHMNDMLRL